MCSDEFFLQKDLLYYIFTKLDFQTICVLKMVNKTFKNIAEEIDNITYESVICDPFYEYKMNVYDFILTNVMYLTMKENALIYFEFLKNVYDKYRIVFIREHDFVNSCFSFMVLFYPFLEIDDDYNTLYNKISKYMFIKNDNFITMDEQMKKEHIRFKYDSLFTDTELNNMSNNDMKILICFH